MNGVWYVVEKFDDADNGYQVEEKITAAEYKVVRKEIDEYGRSGQIKSVQGSTDFIDMLDQSGGFSEGRGSSADRLQLEHGGKNQQIQQVGEISLEGRERAGGDGQRDRSSSSVHRQGQNVKFSLKDSTDSARTKAAEKHRADAVAEFGTTTDFKAAGYVLPDGQMLNMGTPRSPQRHMSIAIMLQRDTQNQRLYLHNVVAIKAEEATTLSQDDSLTNWSDESDSRLFITSILQKAINVKVEKQKNLPNQKRVSPSRIPPIAHGLRRQKSIERTQIENTSLPLKRK